MNDGHIESPGRLLTISIGSSPTWPRTKDASDAVGALRDRAAGQPDDPTCPAICEAPAGPPLPIDTEKFRVTW